MNVTFLKQTTGVVLAFASIASCSAVFASETTTVSEVKVTTTPVVSTTKIAKLSPQAKAFIKLSSALKMYANKVVMANVEKISDTTTRVHYTDEVRDLQAKLAAASQVDVFSGNEVKYDDIRATYKDIYQSLITVNKEVLTIIAGEKSPYALSGATTAQVESLVLGMQKDLVKQIKAALDEYKDGLKETGDLHFALKSDKANVTVDIEKYVSLYSLMLNQQDLDMKMNIRFDIPAASGAIAKAVKGTVMIDGNMKMSGNTLYLTLRDYSITLDNSDENAAAMIAMAKTTLDAYKGKTYRLKAPAEAQQPNVMKTLYDILDVAEQQPLLTAKKVVGNDIFLSFKKEAFASLQKVLSADLDLPATASRDIEKIDGSIIGKLNINGDNFAMTFGDYPRFSVQAGVATLSRTEGSYTATFDLAKTREVVHFLVKNNAFEMNVKNNDFQVNADWKNDYLNAFVIIPEQGRIDINGAYSRTAADLAIKWNNASLGYIRVTQSDKNNVTFDINITLPAPISAVLQYSGKVKVEYEKVQIKFPTQVIDISTDGLE